MPAMLSDTRLLELLAQDAPHGDLTTAALGIGACPGVIRYAARDAMTLACAEEAARMLALVGARPDLCRPEGSRLAAGEVFLTATGPAAALHLAWKVSQTLVEYASGIASRTAAIVAAARAANPAIAVACTRKNFPGSKDIAIRAVAAGGGRMHRLGLSETLLVFAEHRAFLDADPAAAMAALRAREPERRLVVEVATPDEAVAMAAAGAEALQLKKFPPGQVAEVVARTRHMVPPPLVIAAGGVTEANAAAYAATGCGLLVTSAPYFAPPRDVAVRLGPA